MTLTLGSEVKPVSVSRTIQPVRLGVEKLLEEDADLLKNLRVGLICNQASVDHRYRHVADLFHEHAGASPDRPDEAQNQIGPPRRQRYHSCVRLLSREIYFPFC